MHGPINVESPNNTSKWQMGFNSAFKGLITQTALNLAVPVGDVTYTGLQNVKAVCILPYHLEGESE
jgi:hypothetical protein